MKMHSLVVGWAAVLAALATTNCGSDDTDEEKGVSTNRISVDGQEHAAEVSLTGNRQQVTVAVDNIEGVTIFGQQLTALDIALDLSNVHDDDPSLYDILIVANCSKQAVVSVTLGAQPYTEPNNASQLDWNAIVVDGCELKADTETLTLRAGANIDRLTADEIEVAFPIVLSAGNETHTLDTWYQSLSLAP